METTCSSHTKRFPEMDNCLKIEGNCNASIVFAFLVAFHSNHGINSKIYIVYIF